MLLTRSPLITQEQALEVTVRLACVKHAASVRPEPGSNSPLMFSSQANLRNLYPRRVVSLTEQEQLAVSSYSLSTKGFSFEDPVVGTEWFRFEAPRDEVIGIDF